MASPSAPASPRNPEKAKLNAIEKANTATECIGRGYFKSALELLNEAIQIDPDNSQFYAKRSTVYFHQDKFEKALTDANTAIKMDATKSSGHIRKMLTLLHTGDIKGADAAAKDAMKQDTLKASASILSLVASIQFIQEDFDGAIVSARVVLSNTQNTDLLCKAAKIIGASLEEQGADKFKPSSASGKALGVADVSAASFNEASKTLLDEDIDKQIDDLIQSGNRFSSHGNIQSAITQWESAILLAQVMNYVVMTKSISAKLASAYRRIGRPDRSAMVLSSCSEEADSYRGLANTAFSNGNIPRALELFKKVLDIEVEDGNVEGTGNAENNLACVHLASGALEKAKERFERGLAKGKDCDNSSGMITALNGMGTVALRENNYGDAYKSYTEALEVLDTLHDQLVGENPEDDSKHNLYKALFSQTYRGIIEMYQKADKNDLAFEWAERAKSFSYFDEFNNLCEAEGSNDVTIDEMTAAVKANNTMFVSFTFLSRVSLVASILCPDGSVDTRILPWKSNLHFDVPSFVHQVSRENIDANNDDSFAAWKETEKRASVAEGRVLRPSYELLAKIYDALLKPFEEKIKEFGSSGIVMVPHGQLFDVPFSQLIPNRDEPEKRFGAEYPLVLSCSAAEYVRQQAKVKSLEEPKVALVKDATIPVMDEIEKAVEPTKTLDGTKDGIDVLSQVKDSGANIVHLAPRCTRVEVAKAHEARVDTVMGRKLVARKDAGGAVSVQVVGDVGLQGHGSQGWIYFSDAKKPFELNEEVSVVKATHGLPVHKLNNGKFQLPEGSVAVLDVTGAPEDVYVESWGAPLIRACLCAGASAVVVIRHPTARRVDILKSFYDTIRKEGDVPKAVRAAVGAMRESTVDPVDCGAIAAFM